MPPDQDNPFINRDDLLKKIRAEFVAYGAAHGQDYNAKRKALIEAMDLPSKEIERRQHAGEPAACAWQILLELGWLAKYCTDWDVAEQRLADLKAALAAPDIADPVQVEDGSWAGCVKEWYRKLEPTVDMLQKVTGRQSLKPLAFMAPLRDAKAVLARLWQLQITDIRATGRNNRDELGAMQTALSQLIFKDGLRDLFKERPELGFDIGDELELCYTDFLRQTQHPRTGYWGPWYKIGGALLQVQDLSFTYHVINYRAGNVENWPLIVDSTLEIEKLTYPAGWKPNSEAPFNQHNNYDVASIFAFGWPHMTADQKLRVRAKLKEMLDWCLGQSMDQAGFKQEAGTSPADTYYFGVRFLDRLGFWDETRRFWLHRAPALPAGLGTPHDLAVRLSAAFEQLHDHSEESDTVRALLRTASCTSADVTS